MALINFNQLINCNAQSVIDGSTVLYMNASIPQEGAINVSKNINNRDLYFANKEECDLDYFEFNKKVEEIAQNIEDNIVEVEE